MKKHADFFFFYRLHCWANAARWQPHTCNVEAIESCKNMQVYFFIFFTDYTVGQMQPVWQPQMCNLEQGGSSVVWYPVNHWQRLCFVPLEQLLKCVAFTELCFVCVSHSNWEQGIFSAVWYPVNHWQRLRFVSLEQSLKRVAFYWTLPCIMHEPF